MIVQGHFFPTLVAPKNGGKTDARSATPGCAAYSDSLLFYPTVFENFNGGVFDLFFFRIFSKIALLNLKFRVRSEEYFM